MQKQQKHPKYHFSGASSEHWTESGITTEFSRCKREERYHFLIGFVILTTRNVPPLATPAFRNEHSLALGLASRLIQYFSYVSPDHRLGNENFHPGTTSEYFEGAVIYLAIRTCQL